MTKPLYKLVKDHVLSLIESNGLRANDPIPSEHALARELSVSRLTANRGLRELAQEGYIVRVAGLGSFVADRRAHGHPLKVKNIAEEIAERGHEHSAVVLRKRKIRPSRGIRAGFEDEQLETLFHSVIVHKENGTPIQYEDRYVNPKVLPDYLELDFVRHTPTEHLLSHVPLQEVEQSVQAALPGEEIRAQLEMKDGEPCLLINRRTWSRGHVVTIVGLYHPGSRYDVADRYRL